MYELVIVGGGPAGVAAGVYASRKRLRTLFITKEWGGQSVVSESIQNWIGTPSLSGRALAENLKEHLFAYADKFVDVKEDKVISIKKATDGFVVTTERDERFTARAILIASGSKRRQLSVPGADVFEHKGLTYCASCDGPLFAGENVAVIGGGNAAFETAAQLLAYAKSVTLLQRGEKFRADPVTVERVLAHPAMKAFTNVNLEEILGDNFVSGLTYRIGADAPQTLAVKGVFVEIGLVPNTDFLDGLVSLDEYKRIVIDPWTQKTSAPNIWAAGDCTNVRYHQNNISAGDGVRALEDIYVCLTTK
jgi:alkyl hydroperoxide reductase subunit F